MQLCQQAGFFPRIAQEASPPEVLLGLVASGMGISLVASRAEMRHRADVIYRALSIPTPALEIAAAWRKQPASSVLKDFLVLIDQS
jgi:DNA-binding transcriptional LysR family regulator